MPASAMILVIFRWAVAPNQGQRGPASGLHRRRAERVDEFESVEQLGRGRDLAPALGATLQGPGPDQGGLEVDVPEANGQGFENPGASMGERERKSLVGRPRRSRGGLEETPAFIGGDVLAAAGVNELEIADRARHFALRNVRSGSCARPRLGFQEFGNRRDRALQGIRGGPQMRHYVDSVSRLQRWQGVGCSVHCVEGFALLTAACSSATWNQR